MIMEKCGGNLGQSGSVNWMFERKGRWVVPKARDDGEWTEETLMDVVLEAGADDLAEDGDVFVVLSAPNAFGSVNTALGAAGVEFREAGLASVPTQRTKVSDPDVGVKLMKMIDGLEDNDDVQEIFTNEELADDVLKALEG